MRDGRVLITGASGFFGLAIVRALARDGVSVLATDRVDDSAFRVRPGTPPSSVDYVTRDLEHDRLDDLAVGVTAVVYAAAITPADEAAGDTPDTLLRVNLGAFLDLLGGVRRSAACRRVVFVSSAAVYEQGRQKMITEDDATGGTSLYGAAKLAGEIVARRHADLLGWDFCAIRPTSLIGPGEIARPSRPRVTPVVRLVEAARMGRSVRLEFAEARNDWLSVDDAADAVALLLRAPGLGGRAFNVSSGSPRTFGEVAAAVQRAAGLTIAEDGDVVIDGRPDRPSCVRNDRLAALGWKPRRSVDETVRDLLAETDPAVPRNAEPSA